MPRRPPSTAPGSPRAPGPTTATTLGTVDEVIDAYVEQVAFVEGTGSQVILMASRQLAAVAAGADDYLRVYDRILDQVASR